MLSLKQISLNNSISNQLHKDRKVKFDGRIGNVLILLKYFQFIYQTKCIQNMRITEN